MNGPRIRFIREQFDQGKRIACYLPSTLAITGKRSTGWNIKTNCRWGTVFFDIISRHCNQSQTISYDSDGKGNLTKAGQPQEQFNGCIDIDMSLTPFTNTLPIRRLQLQHPQTREIQVLYCDLPVQQIKPVRQQYTCVSATEYHYENIPNDFEAAILVTGSGLVVDYPSLFVRTAPVYLHMPE